jgi:hypothetical protein
MGYVFSAINSPLGVPPAGGIGPGPGMSGSGHWALPMGTTPKNIVGTRYMSRFPEQKTMQPRSYAFGGSTLGNPSWEDDDGADRPLMVLLLFASYMSLMLALIRPEPKRVREGTQ